MTSEIVKATGIRIGRAIAETTRGERLPAVWTGLDAQDGDVATAAGIEPGTPQWAEMERVAEAAFAEAMR